MHPLLHKRDLLQVVEGDSVVGPLENDLVLELNGVILLLNFNNLKEHNRDADGGGDQGSVWCPANKQ